jgi:hypothetical protein
MAMRMHTAKKAINYKKEKFHYSDYFLGAR